ncbi:MAG: MinD/ParA family protein [Gammaproteobacteria bacterium]|jgi:flagellar biosynthesis protein FlhG|nr:MAG: MinD/ParA family protein [Gammaproteobacteria bacterium]
MSDDSNITGGNQADGVRTLGRRNPARVIAIASGKGGVGKTNISVNLSIALAQQGKRVLLLDADLGLANVDVLLGLSPKLTLHHVLSGECTLEDALLEGPAGLQIIPAATGIKKMANLDSGEYAGLIHAFSGMTQIPDVMIVDSAAGISESVIGLACAAQDIVVVVCDEPASLTDAYALIKVLSLEKAVCRFHVVTNMIQNIDAGRKVFEKLAGVADRFLEVTLDHMGSIPHDEYLIRAIQQQKAVIDKYPSCKSAVAFKKLAESVDKWPFYSNPNGDLQFFFEQLVSHRRAAIPGVL